jgi:predicted NBD/HSP70 family sugar kinase
VKREESGLGSLRDLNTERVVETLRSQGVLSRAEIARRTGLSRSTVSNIVADLQAAGLVVDHEGDARPAGPQGGRPPALITLARSAGAALGIDFGKRHLSVAVSDLSHAILAEQTREMDEGYDAESGIRVATELVESVLGTAGVKRDAVLGVGMGLPAPIHDPTGTVGSSSILPGWAGVRAEEEMAERLALPVHVENDANLGALAELTWGAGRPRESLAYLKLATGVGAGLVFKGRLFQGAGGTAGEIGHVTLEENGDICRCGNRGCLETLAGAPAIVGLLSRSHGELDIEQVIALAEDGDAGCRRALADAGRHIGVAVATLCNLVNPELIVVGGSVGRAGDMLLDPLRESVRLRAIQSAADDVEIVPAELGERAELLGAIAVVLHGADQGGSRREAARASAA